MRKRTGIITGILLTALLAGCGAKEPTVTMDMAKVTLGNYVGIEVPVEKTTVTDEDVKEQARQVIYNYNQTAKSDRTVVEDGDTVYITAYMYDEAGELLEDETNNHEGFVQIGSNNTYEELEQGLIGAEVGKELEIPITFPDPYEYDETLSGAKVTSKVTVEYIRETDELTLEDLTDEEAQTAFETDSVDDFYADIRNYLEDQNQENERTGAYNEISRYLLETCTVNPFPDLELKERMDDYMQSVEDMCSNYYNMTFSEYCASIETTEKDYRADIEQQLTDNIKLELILTAIADAEDIQYEEDEYQSYMDNILANFDYESEEAVYEDYDEDYVKRAFRIEYVIDWLIDNADIVYTEPTEETSENMEITEDVTEEPADVIGEITEEPAENADETSESAE